MTLTIVALSTAYAVLAFLLAIIALRTPFPWWSKALAIVVVTGFSVEAFEQTRDMLGWPATRQLPSRFQLLWTRVVEPSRAYNEAGAIYLWVEEIDENNVPSGVPRSYKIRYTEPLAEKAEKARSEIVAGKAQEGTASDLETEGEDAPPGGQTVNEAALPTGDTTREGSQPVDPEFLANAPQHLDFAPMPAPLLPAKPGN
jgi:hypothetical protein